MTKPYPIRRMLAVTLGSLAFAGACKKNPIDAAIDTALEMALDFKGVFEASDGTQIQMNGNGSATVKKVGTSVLTSPLQVGKTYMTGMERTGPGQYSGYVIDKTGLLDRADVAIKGSSLTINRRTSAPSGQSNWQKISNADDTPGTGGTGGTGGQPSNSACQTQWGGLIQGKWNVSSYAFGGTEFMGYQYTKATFEFSSTTYTRNATGRFGADPTQTGPYVINADASANLVGSNRCSIRITYSASAYTVYRIQKYAGGELTLLDSGDPSVPITVVMAK